MTFFANRDICLESGLLIVSKLFIKIDVQRCRIPEKKNMMLFLNATFRNVAFQTFKTSGIVALFVRIRDFLRSLGKALINSIVLHVTWLPGVYTWYIYDTYCSIISYN